MEPFLFQWRAYAEPDGAGGTFGVVVLHPPLELLDEPPLCEPPHLLRLVRL